MDFTNKVISHGNNMMQRAEADNYGSCYEEGRLHKEIDPWREYDMKLAYEVERMKMSVYKQELLSQKKVMYEQAMLEQKVHYQNFLKMQSYTVYSDGKGKIICALNNPENVKITAKELLNVENYRATIFKAFYPQKSSALQITWGIQGDNSLIFLLGADGISPALFLKKLKAKGVQLLVSGRAEKQVANALLAFSLNSAEQLEIPGIHGWNRMENGNWHYATYADRTFKEVLDDVRT